MVTLSENEVVVMVTVSEDKVGGMEDSAGETEVMVVEVAMVVVVVVYGGGGWVALEEVRGCGSSVGGVESVDCGERRSFTGGWRNISYKPVKWVRRTSTVAMCAVTGLILLGEFKVIRKISTRSTLIDIRSFFIPAKKKVVTAYLKVMQSLRSTRKATKADLGLLATGAMLQRKRTSSRAVLKGLKGALVYSNILITVSPPHAQEVWTSQGGHGLHATLNCQSKKFIGILNGIETDAWDPSTDRFLKVQYNADDLQGKTENKGALRKHLSLSSSNAMQPLVGWITRRVPQKGLHLIRHAIYRMLELGGQLVLLGSSPVPHIQLEFEGFVNHFKDHPNVLLILKYDEVLSHSIDAASDMFIIPSIFEPYGLTQLIVMRFGSVPIVRKTGGLNDRD